MFVGGALAFTYLGEAQAGMEAVLATRDVARVGAGVQQLAHHWQLILQHGVVQRRPVALVGEPHLGTLVQQKLHLTI